MKKAFLTLVCLLCTGVSIMAQGVIDIVYDGTTATVTVPSTITDVIYSTSGANVSITSGTTTQEYIYRVSGTSDDGSLVINGSYKLTLQLAGLTLTNGHGGAAIDIECGKRIAVVLKAGTVNTLCDSPLGSQKAALYFKGHPEFQGSGTLNVTGKLKHAISAKEYMEIKSSTGFINILGAVSDGLHCGKGKVGDENNYFEMSGGTINITHVGSEGIDADDYGVVRIKGGSVSINVADHGSGIKADSTLTVAGGTINIDVAGTDADGLRSNYAVNITGGTTDIVVSGDGSKGIKSKDDTDATATVTGGGAVTISGGTTHIEHLGGTFTDALGETSACVGIAADKDLTQTNGIMEILAMGDDCEACRVRGTEQLTGGTLQIIRIPWKIRTHDYEHDMTVYAVVESDGERLADYSDKAVGAFIGDECVGYGDYETADYGILRVRSHTTDADAVSFRLYDYATQTETALTPDRDITFAATTAVGTPSEPVVLSGETLLLGDVNGDGKVNVADVMATVTYVIGKQTPIFIFKAADVNNDKDVNVTDVMGIVNIVLKN